MKIPIEKWHGLGNDFLIIDLGDDKYSEKVERYSSKQLTVIPNKVFSRHAINLCFRNTGIGADGVLIVKKKKKEYLMQIVNSDGSHAEMCGNGIRCAANYFKKKYPSEIKNRLKIKTGFGTKNISTKTIEFTEDGEVKVDMGRVKNYKSLVVKIDDSTLPSGYSAGFGGFYGDIGNPHFVVTESIIIRNNGSKFDEEIKLSLEEKAKKYGSLIEEHDEFKKTNGVNVHFVKPGYNRESFDMRTWERGAGYTKACGTGATTAAFCLLKADKLYKYADPILVKLEEGDLKISKRNNNKMIMTGPAEKICEIQYNF